MLLDDRSTPFLDELQTNAPHRGSRILQGCTISALENKKAVNIKKWGNSGVHTAVRSQLIAAAMKRKKRVLTNFLRSGNHAWRMVITRNLRAVEKTTPNAWANSLLSSVNELKWYPKPTWAKSAISSQEKNELTSQTHGI
jgi:hypothetical protein